MTRFTVVTLTLILSLFLVFQGGQAWAAGEVKTVSGKADSALKLVEGKASATVKTMCGKSYNDGDVATCTTEVSADSDTSGTDGVWVVGHSTRYRLAGSWTTSEAYCLCKITVGVKKTGSPSGTLSLKIYDTDGSNYPGTALGTGTETLTKDDLTTSFADKTFTFSSCVNLSTTTQYWVSLESDTLNDVSNYFHLQYNASGTGVLVGYTTSWSNLDGTARVYMRPYK